MIKVDTYIKDDNKFVPIEQYTGTVPDPMYVEGAIYLKINEREILTLDLWDDVNWLWGYIVTGFEDLSEQSEWTTSFPDQPIDLTFRFDKKRNKAEVNLYIPQCDFTETKQETRQTIAPLDEFLTAMNNAGQKYFTRISEIGGEDGSREARRLREAVKQLYTAHK